MAIEVHDRGDRFEISVDGEPAGAAYYKKSGEGFWAFTHTEIDEAYAGRGLGSTLIEHALDAVRAAEGWALPYCPFVKAYMEKHPAYKGLVPDPALSTFFPRQD